MGDNLDKLLRKYVNENINIFTVVGIFNALAIYSSSIEEGVISKVLSFIFGILSVIFFFPILTSIPQTKRKSYNSVVFLVIRILIFSAQLILFYYIIREYKDYFILLAYILCLIEITPIIFKKAHSKLPSKYKNERGGFKSSLVYILVSVSNAISFIIAILLDKILKYLFEQIG